MSRVLFPGTFDPVTLGHLDVIESALALVDEVVVGVGVNAAKSRLFTAEERIEVLREVTADLPGVSVVGFSGLLTELCVEQGAAAIVKGLRSSADFDYELPMAHMNAALTGVRTLFVPTSPRLSFLSSSLVKEVASLGGDVSTMVPDVVLARLTARLAERAR